MNPFTLLTELRSGENVPFPLKPALLFFKVPWCAFLSEGKTYICPLVGNQEFCRHWNRNLSCGFLSLFTPISDNCKGHGLKLNAAQPFVLPRKLIFLHLKISCVCNWNTTKDSMVANLISNDVFYRAIAEPPFFRITAPPEFAGMSTIDVFKQLDWTNSTLREKYQDILLAENANMVHMCMRDDGTLVTVSFCWRQIHSSRMCSFLFPFFLWIFFILETLLSRLQLNASTRRKDESNPQHDFAPHFLASLFLTLEVLKTREEKTKKDYSVALVKLKVQIEGEKILGHRHESFKNVVWPKTTTEMETNRKASFRTEKVFSDILPFLCFHCSPTPLTPRNWGMAGRIRMRDNAIKTRNKSFI